MLEKYLHSPAKRRSRPDRAPGVSATAPALAGLVASSGQTMQAKPPASAAQAAPAAQTAASSGGLMVVDVGRAVGQTTPENARRDGLTVVDLSDDWLHHRPSGHHPGRPGIAACGNINPEGVSMFEAMGGSAQIHRQELH